MIEECFVEQSIDYSARSHHTFVAFNGLIKILCRACGPTFFLFNNRNTVSGNLTLKPQGSLNKSPFFRFPHPSCSNFPRTRNKKRRRRKKKQKEKNDKTKTETLSGRKFGEHRRCRRWLSIARKGADVENSCGLASTRVWRHQLQATTATERYALSEMHRLNLFAPPAIPHFAFRALYRRGGGLESWPPKRISQSRKGIIRAERGLAANLSIDIVRRLIGSAIPRNLPSPPRRRRVCPRCLHFANFNASSKLPACRLPRYPN